MHRHWQDQEETLRKEQQCAAHYSNESSFGGTCQKGSVLRWKWGQTLLPAPELPPPTNWGWSRTGEGRTVHILLDPTTWGSSQLHWAGFLQVQERMCETMQVHSFCDCEGDCTWRWFHNIHVHVPFLNVLTWHCLCARIFSTSIYIASNTRPCSLSVLYPDIYRTETLTNI